MGDDPAPDRDRAREKYRRLASGYDRFIAGAAGRAVGFSRRRLRAVATLDLAPGDCVIDVGCGTGLSFAAIEERIGPHGRLVGIELSPDMLDIARERVRRHGWTNVTLVESAIEDADIRVEADAALFCLVHDIMRSRPALDHIVNHLKPAARIAVLGGKTLPHKAFPLHQVSRRMLSRYVTTFDGIEQPWTLLAELVPDLRVRASPYGLTYLACGHLSPS
ncbi:MAG: methyltransferase domain-containing protein [Nocardiaceae bacterium]|nr:methyltransferase domain-containing protein [Nocardiaceae bacterium]